MANGDDKVSLTIISGIVALIVAIGSILGALVTVENRLTTTEGLSISVEAQAQHQVDMALVKKELADLRKYHQ